MSNLSNYQIGNLIHYYTVSGSLQPSGAIVEGVEQTEQGQTIFTISLLKTGTKIYTEKQNDQGRIEGIRLTTKVFELLGFKMLPRRACWYDGAFEIVPSPIKFERNGPLGVPHWPDHGHKVRSWNGHFLLEEAGIDLQIHHLHELQNLYAQHKIGLNINGVIEKA